MKDLFDYQLEEFLRDEPFECSECGCEMDSDSGVCSSICFEASMM